MTRVLKCEIANHVGVITDTKVPILPGDIAKKIQADVIWCA